MKDFLFISVQAKACRTTSYPWLDLAGIVAPEAPCSDSITHCECAGKSLRHAMGERAGYLFPGSNLLGDRSRRCAPDGAISEAVSSECELVTEIPKSASSALRSALYSLRRGSLRLRSRGSTGAVAKLAAVSCVSPRELRGNGAGATAEVHLNSARPALQSSGVSAAEC